MHRMKEDVVRMRAIIGELQEDHWKSCCDLFKTHHGDSCAAFNLFFRDFFSSRALPAENELSSIYRINAVLCHDEDIDVGTHAEAQATDGQQDKIRPFAFPLDRLTKELILTVGQFLHIHQLLALSRVNRFIHTAITSSQSTWAAICRRTWRVPDGFAAGSWRETTLQAWRICRRFECPDGSCTSSKPFVVVPIVYGFPSKELFLAMNHRRLVLGDDHIIEGRACWLCLACWKSWKVWPYAALPKAHHCFPDGI